MRTTITIDDYIERKIREYAINTHRTFKDSVNELLRIGLEIKEKSKGEKRQFKVEARHLGFQPGVDMEKLNQLVDDMELKDQIGK